MKISSSQEDVRLALNHGMVVDFTMFNLVVIILYLTKVILYVNYDGSRCNSSIVVQA